MKPGHCFFITGKQISFSFVLLNITFKNNAMKKIAFLFAFLFVSLVSFQTQAQISIPKDIKVPDVSTDQSADAGLTKDLLSAFDPGSSFTSPDKYAKLLGSNKDLVSNVLGVMNGDGSDNDKLAKVDILKSNHKDFVEQLLGEGKAAEYYQKVKDKIEPLTTKYKLAKLFL